VPAGQITESITTVVTDAAASGRQLLPEQQQQQQQQQAEHSTTVKAAYAVLTPFPSIAMARIEKALAADGYLFYKLLAASGVHMRPSMAVNGRLRLAMPASSIKTAAASAPTETSNSTSAGHSHDNSTTTAETQDSTASIAGSPSVDDKPDLAMPVVNATETASSSSPSVSTSTATDPPKDVPPTAENQSKPQTTALAAAGSALAGSAPPGMAASASSGSRQRLNKGQIAGIVLGVMAGVCLIAALLVAFVIARKRQLSRSFSEEPVALTTSHGDSACEQWLDQMPEEDVQHQNQVYCGYERQWDVEQYNDAYDMDAQHSSNEQQYSETYPGGQGDPFRQTPAYY
jgi:hypothetical protein